MENPLDLHRFYSQEALFVPSLLIGEKVSVTAGHGKQQTTILGDKFCEQLTFCCLFSDGKFGYSIERDVTLSPINYLSQLLLN